MDDKLVSLVKEDQPYEVIIDEIETRLSKELLFSIFKLLVKGMPQKDINEILVNVLEDVSDPIRSAYKNKEITAEQTDMYNECEGFVMQNVLDKMK